MAQGISRKSLVAGPIGLAAGQTVTLSVFLPETSQMPSASLQLFMIDGVTGEQLASRDVEFQRGGGTFMVYDDPALVAGGRRCIVGLVAGARLTGVEATMETFDTDTGRTWVSVPLAPPASRGTNVRSRQVIGLAAGQTARLNVWLPPTSRSESESVRLVIMEPFGSSVIATRVLLLERGKGGFLDVTSCEEETCDVPLYVGDHKYLVGVVTSATSAGTPIGMLQVFDRDSGKTREAVRVPSRPEPR